MFTSISGSGHRDDESGDTSERLRFVSSWFRILGFIVVVIWMLAGFAFAAGVAAQAPVPGLTKALVVAIGVGGAALGILLTAPLYFWFSAIASGVADIVDHSRQK
jgi:hypothetical protein